MATLNVAHREVVPGASARMRTAPGLRSAGAGWVVFVPAPDTGFFRLGIAPRHSMADSCTGPPHRAPCPQTLDRWKTQSDHGGVAVVRKLSISGRCCRRRAPVCRQANGCSNGRVLRRFPTSFAPLRPLVNRGWFGAAPLRGWSSSPLNQTTSPPSSNGFNSSAEDFLTPLERETIPRICGE